MSVKQLLPTDEMISCLNESTNSCVKVLDSDGMIMSFNRSGLEIMEIDDPMQVIGKDWLTFWDKETAKQARKAIQDALSKKPGYFEGISPTMKGTLKFWQVDVLPIIGQFKEVDWIIAISRDATELYNLRRGSKALDAIVA